MKGVEENRTNLGVWSEVSGPLSYRPALLMTIADASQAGWKGNQADNKWLHLIIYLKLLRQQPIISFEGPLHHQDSGLDQLAHHIIMLGLASKVLLCI